MICDLAQTYHILNYKELSPTLVATLVLGLEDNSRVRRHFSKQPLTLEQILLSIIADNLQFLSWTKTKDAQKKKNRPKSILNKLMGKDKPKDDLEVFDTPEEFEEFMRNKHE